jgi:Tol biopolymer transport system component
MRRRLLFVTALVISLVAGAATMANRPAEAAFSGLDEQITFTRQLPGGNGEIFAMNSDGSGQTNLTNDPRFDYFSAGSPEGGRIAFTGVLSGDIGDIFVMNADGSDQTNVTNTSVFDVRPDWSPDGTKIAFGSLAGSWEVFAAGCSASDSPRLRCHALILSRIFAMR